MDKQTVVVMELGGFVVRAFRTMVAADSYVRTIYTNATAGMCTAERHSYNYITTSGMHSTIRLIVVEITD